jgi:hypothetical protein
MKPTYTKLILVDGNVVPAPADYTGRHELVRIEHPMLAKPLEVAAYALPEAKWKDAIAAAEKHEVYGLPMRAPTVEEAFFFADRSNYPATPKEFFPDIEEAPWTWTSTVDAESPSGSAWYVTLHGGGVGWGSRSSRGHVRAVRAGQ